MRTIDSFLITYATLVFTSVITLTLIDVETLDVYIALFVILFFVAAELTPTFSPTGSRKKVILETTLLAILVVTVTERLVQILT
jgi:hypothetical protein